MKLITLSGVDGSGKSTQLNLLQEKLKQGGKKVFYFHAIEFSIANRSARTFKGKKEFTPGSEKASVEASWLSLRLRKFFLLIDIFRFKSLQGRLFKEGYDYILSDRYFYDSVVNILYLSKSAKSLWLEQFIPKPNYAFYFQITAEEIIKRDRIPEQGIDYLKDKIALFEEKRSVFELLFINASQLQTSIAKSIATKISI